jgi:hypothetical protein
VVRRWSRFIKKMTASNVILQNPQTRYGSRDGELVVGSHDEKSLFGRGGLQIRANSATGWLWGCAESGWSGSALYSTSVLQVQSHSTRSPRNPTTICTIKCRATPPALRATPQPFCCRLCLDFRTPRPQSDFSSWDPTTSSPCVLSV